MTSHRSRGKRSFVRAGLLAAAMIWGAVAAGAQVTPVCAPSPVLQKALDELPLDQRPDENEYQLRMRRRSGILAVMREYPGNVFVGRAYIRNMSYPISDHFKVRAEYKLLHEQHPDDPQISYLYALTLVPLTASQAIPLLTSALQQAPQFALPHLEFVNIYTAPNFRDKALALAHEKAFLDACPEALDGYQPLTEMDDAELVGRGAAQLQKLLEPRTDPQALGAYPTLWSLEFKAHPASEYDALRRQVGDDLARLRVLNLVNVRQWWSALEEGYKLVNNQKESDWAGDQITARFPSEYGLPGAREWDRDHPRPADDAPADTRRAYYTALLAHTADLVKARPNSIYFWYDRLSAMEHLDNVPAAEVEACLDKAYALAVANSGPQALDWDDDFTFAEILWKKQLEPQRQVDIARQALEQLELEVNIPYPELYATKENVEDHNYEVNEDRVQGAYYEADGYLRLKQADKAQVALTQLDEKLASLKALVAGKDSHRKSYARQESAYWGAMARLAELQGRKLDAMAYYQSALLARLDSGKLPPPGDKDPLGDGARRLWARLGGTDEAWQMWYGRRADALANQSHLSWETAKDPLPAFKLADLHGKTWQIADLKGKVVFLNFWASW